MSKFKVGDKVECNTHGEIWRFTTITRLPRNNSLAYSYCYEVVNEDGKYGLLPPEDLTLVSDQNSPIRTVTVTEIVAGTYGCVNISYSNIHDISVGISGATKSKHLRESGELLINLADALDSGAKVVAR